MKALTQLTATVTDAEFQPRGVLTELNMEDPAAPGWMIGISLSNGGLRFKSRRPGDESKSVCIPLAELVRLAREHAPEVFADESTARAAKAAQLKRQKPPTN
jgi:hypothetical protein